MKVRGPESNRAWIFRDSLLVEGYRTEEVQVSGIEMAREIVQADGEGKFVKNGMRVVPAPSLSFRKNESVYAYFEIYNLKKDTQGQTRYRVEYATQRQKDEDRNLILAGLGRVVGMGREGKTVTVSAEMGGEESLEVVHTALDLPMPKRGLYSLTVKVMDLNSGTETSRETPFRIM